MYVFLFIWYYSTNYLLKLQGYLVLLYKKVSFIGCKRTHPVTHLIRQNLLNYL